MEVKILTMLAEYGPLGIALALVAIIWFKTSKQHTEVIGLMTKGHTDGMNRIAKVVEHLADEVNETNRVTSEIRGMMRMGSGERRLNGARIDD